MAAGWRPSWMSATWILLVAAPRIFWSFGCLIATYVKGDRVVLMIFKRSINRLQYTASEQGKRGFKPLRCCGTFVKGRTGCENMGFQEISEKIWMDTGQKCRKKSASMRTDYQLPTYLT